MLQARRIGPSRRGGRAVASAAGLSLALLSGAARAQEQEAAPATPLPAPTPTPAAPTLPPANAAEQDLRPISVLERQSAREQQRGITLGAVRVYPTATARLSYDSNVFAAPQGRGDFIAAAEGSVAAEIDTSRGSGRVRAEIAQAEYARFSSESTTQWSTQGDVTLLLPADLKLTAEAGYAHRSEPRTSSGAPLAAGRPVEYETATADAELTWMGARLQAALGVNIADFDYDDTEIAGSVLNQQFRDFRYSEIRARLEYQLGGGRQVFVAVDRHYGDYRLPQPLTGLDRDSEGWQALVGVASEITPLVRGSASIGYLRESFDLSTAKSVSSVAFNAALDWLVTPISTIHFDASRRLENSAAIDSEGYLASHLLLRADHELTRRTLVDIGAVYDRAAFRSIDRRDDVFGFQIGVRHELKPGFSARIRGNFQMRRSDGAERGFDFEQGVATIGGSYRF